MAGDCFGFSADGRLLATEGMMPPHFAEARAGFDARALEDSEFANEGDMMTNRDGSLIATLVERSVVRVWSAATGRSLIRATPYAEGVDSLAFGDDGKTLVASAKGKPARTKVWVLRPGGIADPIPKREPFSSLRLPEGQFLARRGDRILIRHPGQDREDLAPAARRACPDFAFHLARLYEAELDRNDRAADFHLRHLLRDPFHARDASLHVHHAHVLARLGRPQEAAARLAWALFSNPQVSVEYSVPDARLHAEAAAADGDWARAAHAFRLEEYEPFAYPSRLSALLAEAAQGIPAGSRTPLSAYSCRTLDGRNEHYQTPALWLALAVPAGGERQARSLLRAAEVSHRGAPNPSTQARLGAAQYRAGRYEDAARTLARAAGSADADDAAFVPLFQALTARRRGRGDEASTALNRAGAAVASRPTKNWRDRVALEALLAETRAAVTAPPTMSGVPEGE